MAELEQHRAELEAAGLQLVALALGEPKHAERYCGKLAPHLEQQMKPGTRLVSISADFPEWESSAFDDRDLLFVYEMPPVKGSLTTYLLKRTN